MSGSEKIPTTSTTLLRDIAQDSQHARWSEFVARYRPMMEAFMRGRFPSLEADDIIQETLIALIKALPAYTYSPDETGHFHNYLTGILRHRALAVLASETRRAKHEKDLDVVLPKSQCEEESEEDCWRKALFEIALQQLLADDTIHQRTKQIFVRVAVNGEKPENVAAAFGLTRNAVDQIKARLMSRLRELVSDLEKVDEAHLDT